MYLIIKAKHGSVCLPNNLTLEKEPLVLKITGYDYSYPNGIGYKCHQHATKDLTSYYVAHSDNIFISCKVIEYDAYYMHMILVARQGSYSLEDLSITLEEELTSNL